MKPALPSNELIEQAVAAEAGGRAASLTGFARHLLILTAVAWSLYQLWIASPLPFWLGVGIYNDTIHRSVHLAFAIVIVFLAFPQSTHSRRDAVPVYDWALLLVIAASVLYIAFFYRELVTRPGSPTPTDIVVSVVGIVGLLEATRRALGKPMMIMAGAFLVYMFAGPYMPEMIAHKGASLSRAASHQWLTTEGVFGVPLGVSTSFVFLYVLFGAMLHQAGAGNYLTRVGFALMGYMRGGPAKAAVVASGLHGLISGSSTANVLTVGNVTITLMKRSGYSPIKAGAIEVAAGSNGQIMPPVMGAAAFLMVEFLNIPYSEIIKHAFLPAILAYASLLYIVHIEALKSDLKGLPRPYSPWKSTLINWGIAIASLFIIFRAGLWLSDWLPTWFGEQATLVAGLLIAIIYGALIWLSARYPAVDGDIDPRKLTETPETKPTVLGGAYFILPVWVLVWCLMVLEQSPALAAFYACLIMTLILVTQRPLVAWARGQALTGTVARGIHDLYESLQAGARNMVPIAIATACAGIIVGAVSLTGIGQALADVVEALSFGSLIGVLVLTALLSLILGMGLPTTANYIVVATLLAPVIVSLAASHGMAIPLIAVHLFVFYFGIMADATPPVALAAYAAAGISGADPLKTGVQGFIYEMRTAILPFVFVFNHELLMIGIDSPWEFGWVVFSSLIACFAFASVTQRFWLVQSRLWETLVLVVVVFTLFRPDVYRDWVSPPYVLEPATQVAGIAAKYKEGDAMRLRMEVDDGKQVTQQTYALTIPKNAKGDPLTAVGLITEPAGDRLRVIDIPIDSVAEKARLDVANKNVIVGIEVRRAQPWKGWFTLPAFLLIGIVYVSQKRRRASSAVPAMTQ
jgi:TRAP-type uncharacterized transport system fused permease subunit